MRLQAVQRVMDYAEKVDIQIQITHSGNKSWYVDFRYELHAETCYQELVSRRHVVKLLGKRIS